MKKQISLYLVVICSVMLASCSNMGAMKNNDDLYAKNKAIVQKTNDAFFAGNAAPIDSFVSADFIDHSPAPGMRGKGTGDLKKMISDFHAAFPDGKGTVSMIMAEGDNVSQWGTYTGTNTGSFMGMPPTNKSVKIDFADFFIVKDGKITEHWGMMDVPAMMQQMGMPMGDKHDMAADSAKMKMDMAEKMNDSKMKKK